MVRESRGRSALSILEYYFSKLSHLLDPSGPA